MHTRLARFVVTYVTKTLEVMFPNCIKVRVGHRGYKQHLRGVTLSVRTICFGPGNELVLCEMAFCELISCDGTVYTYF